MTYQIEVKDKIKNQKGIKVAPFKKTVRKTAPHKHNSYIELVYLSAGSGHHTIDTDNYPIAPPVLHIIKQDQLHFWDIAIEPEGYVLLLKKIFIDEHFDPELNYLLSRLSLNSVVNIFTADAPVIESLFELVIKENESNPKQINVLIYLLKALVGKLIHQADPPRQKSGSNLYFSFCEYLSTQPGLVNSVSYYATLLHTTPQNLNAACQREAGRPASALLGDRIISEASRLLLYTSQSVSQIAYQLGFKDNSHFSKYFRRNTGLTPSAFRKSGIL